MQQSQSSAQQPSEPVSMMLTSALLLIVSTWTHPLWILVTPLLLRLPLLSLLAGSVLVLVTVTEQKRAAPSQSNVR